MAEDPPASGRREPKIGTPAGVESLLSRFPDPDWGAAAACRAREAELTKPAGALGRLEALTEWLCAWQGRYPPRLDNIRALVFAGNHGVAARSVSAYPAAVTAQMVEAFRSGHAAVNQLCRTLGVDLAVHPIELDRPTADFTLTAAMSDEEFAAAFHCGYRAAASGGDLLCLGEMGIGNTTAAAALAMALYGGAAEDWTGPGTGVQGEARQQKVAVVRAAVERHAGATVRPFDLLRRVGGRELAAMAGAVVAARLARMPVLLDGFVVCAAAAAVAASRSDGIDHCRIGHVSAEPGHRRLLDRLGQTALLDLGLRLGEASGAVLAVGLVRAAVACHLGMATFGEAGVAKGPPA